MDQPLGDKATAKQKQKRMTRDARREQIIETAVRLFSEEGFETSTHRLAEVLGVTQPLIYRYFPNKEDLITAVYEHVFLQDWNASWDRELSDSSIHIEDRLAGFYTSYTRKIFDPDWIRIYLFSGLKRLDINRWYMALVEGQILSRIGSALRASYGLPGLDEQALSPAEIEGLWLFHGGIFYYGIRESVYAIAPKVSRAEAMPLLATAFVSGMRPIMERACTVEKETAQNAPGSATIY
jgi:AcrR family transcriptional regulator